MKSRVSDIRLLLQCNKTVYTRQLVKLFQVDSRTIRRDLIQLEQLGIAERFYGGAHFIQSSDKTQKLDSINLGDFVPQFKEYSAKKIGHKKKEGSSDRIITLGSFNVDIINRVKRFPVPEKQFMQ